MDDNQPRDAQGFTIDPVRLPPPSGGDTLTWFWATNTHGEAREAKAMRAAGTWVEIEIDGCWYTIDRANGTALARFLLDAFGEET